MNKYFMPYIYKTCLSQFLCERRRIATSPNIVVVADTNVAKVAAARAAADTDATQVLWTISAEVMDAEDTPTKHQKVKVPDEDKIDIKLKKADDDDDDDQSKENEEVRVRVCQHRNFFVCLCYIHKTLSFFFLGHTYLSVTNKRRLYIFG